MTKKENVITKTINSYKNLPRSVYILFIARIVNRIGGFVYFFLALYLKSKLNMTAGEIANYMLIMGGFSMISPFIGGYIADKKGRKLIYVVAQSAAAALFLVCGLVTKTNPHIVPVLIIIASVINHTIGPISSAMVADIVQSPQDRKRAFSLLYLGINLGVAIGPILGGFLLENYVEWFFIGDAITTFISVGLVAVFVKETMLTKEEMEEVKGEEKMEKGFALAVFVKKPVLAFFTLFAILNAAVYAQSSFALPLQLEQFLGKGNGPVWFGWLMSFNAITVLLFTVVLTEMLKENKPITNISIASALNTIGFGMLALVSTQIPIYFVSTFIWTIAEIIAMTNFGVFIMSQTPVNYRGRFNAIIDFLTGAGFIMSPKIVSYFIEGFSFSVAWQFIGIISFVSFIGFFAISFVSKKQTEVKEAA